MSDLKFHSASDYDLDTLDDIHTQCMKPHVQRHYEWKPHLFRENFVPSDYVVCKRGGEIVAFYKLVEESHELYLADMMVRPDCQNEGLGGRIIDRIFLYNRSVRLQVLKSNPARALYERKGFDVIEEKEHHFVMKRVAS